MPRYENEIFSCKSVHSYLSEYLDALQTALLSIDPHALERLSLLLQKTARTKKHIFVAGNGGSAAIACHLCCDWTKNTYIPEKPPLITHTLVANESILTALANDHGYETVFSKQLEYFAEAGDTVLLISSSGKSSNVLEAARIAKQLKVNTVGFTGFTGGDLGKVVDLHIHVPFQNYGVVEDGHQILMHVFAQFINAVWKQTLKDQAA